MNQKKKTPSKNVGMVKVLQYFTQMYNTYTYLINDYD
jgi:hypothetical protein